MMHQRAGATVMLELLQAVDCAHLETIARSWQCILLMVSPCHRYLLCVRVHGLVSCARKCIQPSVYHTDRGIVSGHLVSRQI